MAFFSDEGLNAVLSESLDKSNLQLFLKDRPLLDRITKVGGVGGSAKRCPFNAGGYGGGRGGDFAASLAAAVEGIGNELAWIVTPQSAYGHSVIDNTQALYTEDSEHSAADAMTQAAFAAAENCASEFNASLFGDGHGTLATIVSNTNPSGTQYILVFATMAEATNFGVDDLLVSKATPTAALDAGTARVLAVNPMNQSITVDAGASGWTPTNTHVLGRSGTMVAGSALSTFAGIFAFVPPFEARTNHVVGDTLFGITRDSTATVTSVSGWDFDGRGKSLVQSLTILGAMMATFKESKPNTCILNPISLSKLQEQVQAQVRYMPAKTSGVADINYEGFDIMLAGGKVDCLADATCPTNRVVLTKAETWVFEHPGKSVFKPTSPTGRMYVEDFNNNRIRFSLVATGFFYTNNPSATGVVTI